MLVKDAKKITGSMTRTSKMPGLSYSLPAWECQVGSKLRAVKGSVCSGCYALKGNYTRYPAIKRAQYYRLASLMDPRWTTAMVAQIKRQNFLGGTTLATCSPCSISRTLWKYATRRHRSNTGYQLASANFCHFQLIAFQKI